MGVSPPVILAFGALGMFTGAILAVFGSRWMNRVRQWELTLAPDDGVPAHLEPPRLWDLESTCTPGVIVRRDCGWKDIMPMAAHRIVQVPAKGRQKSLPRFFKPVVGLKSPEMVEEGRLQVAVSIAMPCPHRPRLLTSIRESTEEGTEQTAVPGLVYVIGLLDVPYSKPASGLDDR